MKLTEDAKLQEIGQKLQAMQDRAQNFKVLIIW
jgi:hypothetical protein